jgi:hypothetical protein
MKHTEPETMSAKPLKLYDVIKNSGNIEPVVARALRLVLSTDKHINHNNYSRVILIVSEGIRNFFRNFSKQDVIDAGTKLKIESLEKELKETKGNLNKQRKSNGDLRKLLEKCDPNWRDKTKELKNEPENPII